MSIRTRRIRAWFLRLIAPGYSCCLHCGTPWKFVDHRPVQINPGRAFFFACVDCWPLLDPAEKYMYAQQAVYGIGWGWRRGQSWPLDRAKQALDALRGELRNEAS